MQGLVNIFGDSYFESRKRAMTKGSHDETTTSDKGKDFYINMLTKAVDSIIAIIHLSENAVTALTRERNWRTAGTTGTITQRLEVITATYPGHGQERLHISFSTPSLARRSTRTKYKGSSRSEQERERREVLNLH